MAKIGDPIPTATLKLTTRDKLSETVELDQLVTNKTTVLYFFPAIFTGVCTKSSCELRDDLEDFGKLNTQIFSISVDMPFSQQKFIQEHNINYPVLSDWNNELIEKLDIVDNNFAGFFKGVAKRSLFLIEESKISYAWIADHPGQYPPFDEIKAYLRQ